MAAWAAAAEGRPPGAHPRLTWTCRVHRPLPRPRGLESAGSDRDRGGIGPEGAAAVHQPSCRASRRRSADVVGRHAPRVERGRTRRVHGGVRLGAPPRLSPACGRSRSRCDRHQVPSSRRPSTLTPGGRPSGAGRTRPARPRPRRSHRPTGPFPRAHGGQAGSWGRGRVATDALEAEVHALLGLVQAANSRASLVHGACRGSVRSPVARGPGRDVVDVEAAHHSAGEEGGAPSVHEQRNGGAGEVPAEQVGRDLAPQSTRRPAGPPALRRSVAQHLLRRLQQPARLWAPPSSTERIHLGRVVDSDSRGSSP